MGTPGTYNDGKPYLPARGRNGTGQRLESHCQAGHPIVTGRPTTEAFLRTIEREMKIRAYQRTSISKYCSALRKFLNWFGDLPHLVDIEDVRQFLELQVDGGAESSTLVTYLSSIRMAFDKFCFRNVTLGLATPRKRKRLPIVPSREEIVRLIKGTRSARDRLLVELMHASGLRVSELSKLTWAHVDFDHMRIRVQSGKGKRDRLVLLPECCRVRLGKLYSISNGQKFLFPSTRNLSRHISTRTIERIVSEACANAGIRKHLTPHSLRHGFATHLVESGTDIKFVQKLLGHANQETTAIYTQLAHPQNRKIQSPLDSLRSTL